MQKGIAFLIWNGDTKISNPCRKELCTAVEKWQLPPSTVIWWPPVFLSAVNGPLKRAMRVHWCNGLQDHLDFTMNTGESKGETWALSYLKKHLHACHIVPSGAGKKYVIWHRIIFSPVDLHLHLKRIIMHGDGIIW